jgi:hypothetical protein
LSPELHAGALHLSELQSLCLQQDLFEKLPLLKDLKSKIIFSQFPTGIHKRGKKEEKVFQSEYQIGNFFPKTNDSFPKLEDSSSLQFALNKSST